MQFRLARHRVPDERQGARPERLGDQARRDVEAAIAVPFIRSGAAVMRLVGMDHERAARLAVQRGAAIAERLHAAQRDADGVAVVPVRRKAHRGEARLGALEAGPRAAAADAVSRVRTIVQDPLPPRWSNRDPREDEMFAENLGAFVIAAFALTGSPGPATLGLSAAAAAFGLRRSLMLMTGIIAGVLLVFAAAAAGLTGLILAQPLLGPIVKAASVLYMLWLAWSIATAPPLSEAASGHAPSFWGGMFLGVGNPKAYAAMAALSSGFVLAAAPLADALLKGSHPARGHDRGRSGLVARRGSRSPAPCATPAGRARSTSCLRLRCWPQWPPVSCRRRNFASAETFVR